MPASLMAREIEQPGRGQLRALFVSAGNPVLSVPDGPGLERALGGLDLLVGLDLFVNETNRHADYVLPATTFLERDDLPVASLALYTTPFIQYTDPVLEPAGEARPEWEVVEALSRALGIVPSSVAPVRWSRLRLKPRTLLDLLLRAGSRNRLSLAELRRHPHGLVLAPHVRTGVLRRRVRLHAPEIEAAVRRLADAEDPEHPLRLLGLRELRAHNSWMRGVPKLMAGRAHTLRMHPDDAAAAGLGDGDVAEVASRTGALTVPVRLTDEVMRGVVALPHGWPGANVNVLASAAPDDLEPYAGMPRLNGIPVRVGPPTTPATPSRPPARGRVPSPAPR
jgi:formate dehydrogenase